MWKDVVVKYPSAVSHVDSILLLNHILFGAVSSPARWSAHFDTKPTCTGRAATFEEFVNQLHHHHHHHLHYRSLPSASSWKTIQGFPLPPMYRSSWQRLRQNKGAEESNNFVCPSSILLVLCPKIIIIILYSILHTYIHCILYRYIVIT